MKKPKITILSTLFLTAISSYSYSNNMSNFYTDSTFVALAILSVVLILISGLLWGIKRNLKAMHRETAEVKPEPSYYVRKIKPVISRWNPVVATLVIGGAILLVLFGFAYEYGMTEVGIQQGYSPEQPINFSHEIHAGQYEIDCKYCHSVAEKSRSASIPSVNTCMNCHRYVQAKEKYNGNVSPEIQLIYDAIGYDAENAEYIEGYEQKPIKWVRIHNLPDLAYFNHSQHTKVGGVECQTCHGPIETMDKVEQFSLLTMGWCVNCHRERGIDAENNDYYIEVHERMKAEGKDYMTVAENGGLECGKCHY